MATRKTQFEKDVESLGPWLDKRINEAESLMKRETPGSPESNEYYGKVSAYDRVKKHLQSLGLIDRGKK